MANLPPLPTLSDNAWVTSSKDKIEYALSHFYESQYSQTQFYLGNVSSMSYLLYQYGTNPPAMADAVEETLSRYLARYVSNVTVECSANASENNRASINIYVEFSNEQGNPVTLSNLLLVENSKLVQVINANNTGQATGTPIGGASPNE